MNLIAWSLALSRRWGRTLVRLGAGLFGLSTVFPVAASLLPAAQMPRWLGILDVALALLLAMLALIIVAAASNNIPSRVKQFAFQVYRTAAGLPLLLFALFLIAGDRLNWTVLLAGLAWRVWLGAFTLPAALTLWELSSSSVRRGPNLDKL